MLYVFNIIEISHLRLDYTLALRNYIWLIVTWTGSHTNTLVNIKRRLADSAKTFIVTFNTITLQTITAVNTICVFCLSWTDIITTSIIEIRIHLASKTFLIITSCTWIRTLNACSRYSI